MLGKIEDRRRKGRQRMSWPERHPQLSLATRGEDWASQGQPKGARGGFLPRHDEDLMEPLLRRQGSQVSMRVARGERVMALESREGWLGN